jgi:hypothetical protein
MSVAKPVFGSLDFRWAKIDMVSSAKYSSVRKSTAAFSTSRRGALMSSPQNPAAFAMRTVTKKSSLNARQF